MSETMPKKKIDNILLYLTIGIYLYFTNIANHTIYSDIAIILLIAISFIYIIKTKKIYLNIYFFLYILFIIYQLFLVASGVAVYKEVTLNTIHTMFRNLIVLICLYNLVICTKNIDGIMKVYIIGTAISLGTIMFLLRQDLFLGRLGHAYGKDSVSFYFLGKAIAMSSNGIAFSSAVSVMFSLFMYHKSKNISYIIVSLFFIFGIILTGSRKGIIVLVLYCIYVINLIYKNKIGRKILFAIFVTGGIWIAITKIPVLYNIIGKRLGELINNFLGNETTEGSIVAREMFKNYANQWILKRPWLGYGIGAFYNVYGNVTESNYLEMMVSGGIVGTIIYYLYLIPVVKKYMTIENKDNISKILFFIIISICIIEYGSVTYLSLNYLMLIVIFLAYAKILKKERVK